MPAGDIPTQWNYYSRYQYPYWNIYPPNWGIFSSPQTITMGSGTGDEKPDPTEDDVIAHLERRVSDLEACLDMTEDDTIDELTKRIVDLEECDIPGHETRIAALEEQMNALMAPSEPEVEAPKPRCEDCVYWSPYSGEAPFGKCWLPDEDDAPVRIRAFTPVFTHPDHHCAAWESNDPD